MQGLCYFKICCHIQCNRQLLSTFQAFQVEGKDSIPRPFLADAGLWAECVLQELEGWCCFCTVVLYKRQLGRLRLDYGLSPNELSINSIAKDSTKQKFWQCCPCTNLRISRCIICWMLARDDQQDYGKCFWDDGPARTSHAVLGSTTSAMYFKLNWSIIQIKSRLTCLNPCKPG